MEAVASVERGLFSGSVLEIIVGEFGKWQVVDPIILLIRTVRTKVCFKSLISAFRESVCSGMISGRSIELELELFREFLPELRNYGGQSVQVFNFLIWA